MAKINASHPWDLSVDSNPCRSPFSGIDDFSCVTNDNALFSDDDILESAYAVLKSPRGSVTTGYASSDFQAYASTQAAALPGVSHVQAFLGAGSCGHVFRCAFNSFNEEVAVKVLTKTIERDSSREAMLVNLVHPNLIQIRQVFDGPPLCLMMELCTGGTVAALLHDPRNAVSKTRVTPLARARGALDIANALAYLHSFNLVHRDVKASNCFLKTPTDAGTQALPIVKLGDLGSCRAVEQVMTVCVGTFAYMAPEVLESENYGLPVDIFSLGIMLNELISGDIPFKSEKSTQRIPILICGGKRPELATFQSGMIEVQLVLQSLVLACWDQEPHLRPCADVVKVRLEALLASCESDSTPYRATSVAVSL